MRRIFLTLITLISLTSLTFAQDNAPITLTLAAYTVPAEAYGQIIPLFEQYWLETSGQQVTITPSYAASGAQSRAVAGGLEADVVALSLENDVTRLVDAGLIMHDWRDNPYNGMVSTSLAVLVVREGNPKNITDWVDIVQEGVGVLTPDPITSGGAQWNVLAAYGAAYRGNIEGYEAGEAGALQFLSDVFANVAVLDESGRQSFLTFQSGIGDVAITYENEYFAAVKADPNTPIEIIYPSSTILIENPVAVVDTYVDAHGTREVAEAFVEFLYQDDIQAIFADYGFRPPVRYEDAEADTTEEAVVTEEAVATEEPAATAEAEASLWGDIDTEKFPLVQDLFTVEEFGGWSEIGTAFFVEGGIYFQATGQ